MEQVEFKLEKILGFRNMQEKLEKKFFPKFYILKWKKVRRNQLIFDLEKQKSVIFGSLKFDEILVGL